MLLYDFGMFEIPSMEIEVYVPIHYLYFQKIYVIWARNMLNFRPALFIMYQNPQYPNCICTVRQQETCNLLLMKEEQCNLDICIFLMLLLAVRMWISVVSPVVVQIIVAQERKGLLKIRCFDAWRVALHLYLFSQRTVFLFTVPTTIPAISCLLWWNIDRIIYRRWGSVVWCTGWV